MKVFLLIILVSLFTDSASARDSAHFDAHGNLIPPDQVMLLKGLEHDHDGYKNMALKLFKKSAMYGNEYAMFFSGMINFQQESYVDAYAWLMTVDAIRINRVDKVELLLKAAAERLSPNEKQLADDKATRYKKIYNSVAASIHRQQWVNGFMYTGSRIKGNDTTPGKKIFVNAQIEGSIIQGTMVNQSTFETDLNDFVVNYKFDLPASKVELKEIELIDKDS